MADNFQDSLENPDLNIPAKDEKVSEAEIIKELNDSNQKDYYAKLKKKNKNFLVNGLTLMEREKVAQHIIKLYNEEKSAQLELADKLERNDEVFRMIRQTIPGDDGTMPNYRSPMSAVTLEVIHANIMNVFFTPKEVGRVLPTEENDISKVGKLTTFMNWSIDNELKLFENMDRLWHSSNKNGESPYMVYWKKEFAPDIKREMLMNPVNPDEPLYDPDTQQPLYQETEEMKLVYNAPYLEVFSRKDYVQPSSSRMDEIPAWEGRIVRKTYDCYLREELEGKMYDRSIEDITDWSGAEWGAYDVDMEGLHVPLGKWEQEFFEFYGRLRLKLLKEGKEEVDEYKILEDEFIALVHIKSGTLCQLRKNKFPLKMRPIGVDYFIPDDEGRRVGLGVIDMMDGVQKAYDTLFNQYIWGIMMSNNPPGFFNPMANQQDEPIKAKLGFLHPTADPGAITFAQVPGPNQSLERMLEIIRYWAQLLFGISDYASGIESQIDPSAPAKKAEIVVSQGSVRLNMIIKRKNKTLQDIFKRWFLLYKENLPPNKFMRITGDNKNNPWKFEGISLSDFALKSIPDFELTGNILNVNKTLEVQKRMATYNILKDNFLFNPQTAQGLKGYYELTRWFIDGLDEIGLSRMLPKPAVDDIHTAEEENALFLQGDDVEPKENEDFIYHLMIHRDMLSDLTVPEEIKQKLLAPHINKTIELMQQSMLRQKIAQNHVINPINQIGGGNGQPTDSIAQTNPRGLF